MLVVEGHRPAQLRDRAVNRKQTHWVNTNLATSLNGRFHSWAEKFNWPNQPKETEKSAFEPGGLGQGLEPKPLDLKSSALTMRSLLVTSLEKHRGAVLGGRFFLSARAQLLFYSLKVLFGDVFVAVAVLVCWSSPMILRAHSSKCSEVFVF